MLGGRFHTCFATHGGGATGRNPSMLAGTATRPGRWAASRGKTNTTKCITLTVGPRPSMIRLSRPRRACHTDSTSAVGAVPTSRAQTVVRGFGAVPPATSNLLLLCDLAIACNPRHPLVPLPRLGAQPGENASLAAQSPCRHPARARVRQALLIEPVGLRGDIRARLQSEVPGSCRG